MTLKKFGQNPKKLKFMCLHIPRQAQGYSPRKMLQGEYLIVSVHPFGLTMEDQEKQLCSILWMHTKEDWVVSPNQSLDSDRESNGILK